MDPLPDTTETDGSPLRFIAYFGVITGPQSWIIVHGLAAMIAATLQTVWLDEFVQLIGDTAVAVPALLSAFIVAQLTGYFLLCHWPKLLRIGLPLHLLLVSAMALSTLMTPLFLEVFDYVHVTIFGREDLLPVTPGIPAALYYFLAGYCVVLAPLACAGATLAIYQHAQGHVSGLVETSSGLATGYAVGWYLTRDHAGYSRELWLISSITLILCFTILAYYYRRYRTTAIKGLFMDRNDREVSIYNRVLPAATTFTSFGTLISLFLSAVALAVLYSAFVNLLVAQQGYLRHSPVVCVVLLFCGIGLGGLIYSRLPAPATKFRGLPGLAYSLIALIGTFPFSLLGFPTDSGVATLREFFFAMYLLLSAIAILSGVALQHTLTETRNRMDQMTVRMPILMLLWPIGFPIGLLLAGICLAGGTTMFLVLTAGNCLFILSALLNLRQAQNTMLRKGCLLFLFIAAGINLYASREQNRMTAGTDNKPISQFLGRDNIATVSLKRGPAGDALLINGLAEAIVSNPLGSPQNDPQRWLTALPFALMPTADSLLLVGGAGVAPQDLPPMPGYMDVVDPSSQVLKAYSLIHGNKTVSRGWRTPQVTFHTNDIYNLLSLTERRYDIIVTSPLSPARPWSEQLETMDLLRHVKRHLKEGGIYVHGIVTNNTSLERLHLSIERLLSRFEDVQLFQTVPGVLYLLASDTALEPRIMMLQAEYPLLGQIEYFSRSGINTVEDLLLAWRMNREMLAAFVENPEEKLLNYTDLPAVKGALELNWIYIASRLLALGFPEQAAEMRRKIRDLPTTLIISALESEQSGKPDTAEDLLLKALALAPQNQIAGYLLVRNYLDDLAIGSAPGEIKAIARELQGPPLSITRIWTSFLGNDWYGILPFERELARVEPLDPWYAEAALLRASWRINIDNSDYRRAMLIEAIRIIDRALASYHSGRLYLTRARAASLLGQSATVLETAREVAGYYERQLLAASSGQEPKLLHRLLAVSLEAAQMRATLREAFASRETESEVKRLDRRYAKILERVDAAINSLRRGLTK